MLQLSVSSVFFNKILIIYTEGEGPQKIGFVAINAYLAKNER